MGDPSAKFQEPPTLELINDKKQDRGTYQPIIGVLTQTTGQRQIGSFKHKQYILEQNKNFI